MEKRRRISSQRVCLCRGTSVTQTEVEYLRIRLQKEGKTYTYEEVNIALKAVRNNTKEYSEVLVLGKWEPLSKYKGLISLLEKEGFPMR